MSERLIDWGTDLDHNQREIDRVARDLHEKVKTGERTQAELRSATDKLADGMRKIDEAVAGLKGQVAAAATREIDGSESELRQFIRRDATQGSEEVALWTRKAKFCGREVGEVPGLLDTETNHSEWHLRAKELTEAAFIAAAARTAGRGTVRDNRTLAQVAGKELAALGMHLESGGKVGRLAAERVRRVFNDTNGTGGEFIPGEIRLPMLDRALALSNYGLVTDNLDVMEITGKNIKIPFADTLPRASLYGVASIDDPANFATSTPGTSERTITPVSYAISIPLDRDSIDDSLVDVLPEFRAMAARAAVLTREDAAMNADTASTHQDDASGNLGTWNPNSLFAGTGGGTGDHRRGQLGWRARVFDIGASAQLDAGTGFTYDEALALAAKLGGTQHIPGQDLALMVSYEDYIEHIMAIDEVKTLDKYGPQASVLSGEVARLGPWRVLKTPVLTQEFESTGLYTDGSGALGTMVGVNLSRYRMVRRRGVRVEMSTEIRNGMVYIVVTFRELLHNRDASTVRNVVAAINV